MLGSIVLAVSVLAVFLGGAAAMLRFGTNHLDPRTLRITAGATALVGAVLFAVILAAQRTTEPKALFETLVERNQGAVSYVFFVEQPGEPQELRVWPQRAMGAQEQDALTLRIVLNAPGSREMLNEVVQVPTVNLDVQLDDGRSARAQEWAAWTYNFTPAEAGMYELALGLPTGAPQVQVRIGEPEF